MLNIFQRIRRELLAEVNLGAYLVYAIGEIFLVTVGILLALQFNNWNEARKARIEEIIVLDEIVEDLQKGMEEMQRGFGFDRRNIRSLQIVIKHMTDDLAYHDSLNPYFYNLHAVHLPEISSSGFETVKSKGLEIISNDSLRKEMITLFDQRLKYMREAISYDGRMRHEEFHNSEYIQHFKILSKDLGDSFSGVPLTYTNANSMIIPLDYDALIADQRFENFLRSIYDNNKWMSKVKRETYEEMKSLQQNLREELERLK